MTIAKISFFTFLLSISLIGYSSITFKYPIINELLTKLDDEVRDGSYGKITGIVIVNKNGKLLYERYYGFSSKSTINPISSVTKSITSVVVGVCLDKGYIHSIDTPVWKYFPEYVDIFKRDTIKKKITIRHLLNQTTGLRWEEWRYPYNYASNSLIALLETENNWVEKFFNLPIENEPGVKFCYNSLASQVIAEVLSRASGISFEQLTKQYLFDPLQISTYNWDKYSANGLPAWGGIALTTQDMAKIGLVVLNNGMYGDKQVVSKSWIEESTKSAVSYNESVGYGLHWWMGKQPDGNALIYAAGYGDQYVYVAPDKEIVIAINSQNFFDYRWPKSVEMLVNSILSSMIHPNI